MTRERAVDYFRLFEAGNIAALDALPWQVGDGDPRSPEQRERQREAVLAPLRARQDRDFLAELGPERPEEPCRHAGCSRGAVRLSVLCRGHHFEAVMKRPYPFD